MSSLESEVLQILEEIKPYVLSHGGSIEFVKFDEGILYIRLSGACATCPMSIFTVSFGIEERVKARIPEVRRVSVIE